MADARQTINNRHPLRGGRGGLASGKARWVLPTQGKPMEKMLERVPVQKGTVRLKN